MSALRITEIFLSLQGEANTVGKPTVFVRLTGCPLRCHYCDSAYAFSGGELIEEADILNTVKGFGVQHVTVTGGEPLAQPGALSLMVALADAGLSVSIETSGALSVAEVDPRVVKVLDLKTPGSGEVQRNLWENMRHLNAHDQIKFVVCDRADYDWARTQSLCSGGRCAFFPEPSSVGLSRLSRLDCCGPPACAYAGSTA